MNRKKNEEKQMIPQEFEQRMQNLLQTEYPDFIKSFENSHVQSLRRNPLKGSREDFLKKMPFQLEQVPWEQNGFYYGEEEQPGKHPFHEAGAYYIQEASAMAPAVYLDVKPGERVLDLCAAPGGKSTQLGAAMDGKGLLVCNEIHPARAKILSENIERMGIRNALVTNETPEKLAEYFPGYFDKILVDAPCSGEGMFRKHPEACSEWSVENVEMCALRQDAILDCAAQMLREGGRLVYSTCTFAPAEDEGSVLRFLRRQPGFSIEAAEKFEGMAPGNQEWAREYGSLGEALEEAFLETHGKELDRTIRLFPHLLKGEGHYLAVLQKSGETQENVRTRSLYGIQKGISEKDCRVWREFEKENLNVCLDGTFLKFGDQIYVAPKELPALQGLKVLRPGLHLGTLKKDRFEPSHALALALKPADVRRCAALDISQARQWIGGMTAAWDGEKGWYLVTAEGYGLGWGKLAGGILKNHYPKGLRKLL